MLPQIATIFTYLILFVTDDAITMVIITTLHTINEGHIFSYVDKHDVVYVDEQDSFYASYFNNIIV